ncbi:hypothetical protein [Mycolicibacterium sp. J2]|uniref:hypothetical protein n=1 Tax=Mycolicibacterium sp. J2 TaxID=2993511 RepID=UPI00224B06FB|nr:hypothetical protein [Mycolicibacterium sp. J2]MCX2714963.1 hypothetical protein [Mycolicibacterium sp. J2]
MMNLDTIPTPAPDCTPWREVCDGHYRYFNAQRSIQFAYPDGSVITYQHWDD